MKIKSRIRLSSLLIYVLVISTFFNNFLIQYTALCLFFCVFLLGRPKFKNNIFFNLPFALFALALISFLYNLYKGNADIYSMLFWLFSYFPPFLLIWLIISYNDTIDFIKIYGFYKKLVYFQSFLLIFSAIKYQTYIVGDMATGTVGDANWVAFHICVVLIYEITKVVEQSKTGLISWENNVTSLLEIVYFLIIFLIPESTANLGFFLIVIAVLFFKEFILAFTNVKGIILFFICSLLGLYLLSETFVYKRIESAVTDLTEDNIDKNPYLFKASIYKKLANGTIYSDVNILVGAGPATFTSRSSVIRMPEERVNDFPLELPYFKNQLFSKYISPMYAQWRKSGESYGNFASPQTTVISVAVELGIVGLFIFVFFFTHIIKAINTTVFPIEETYLKKFAKYFTLYFILSLFHLNFWEYPIVTFTYIIFIFLLLKDYSALTPSCSEKKDL